MTLWRWVCATPGRLGRRGASLLILGALFTLYGLNLLNETTPSRLLQVLVDPLPLAFWGWAWIVAGVTAGVQAFTCSREAVWSFTSLAVVSWLWAAGFIAAWVRHDVPNGHIGTLLFASLAALIIVIAGWPEPRRLPPAVRKAERPWIRRPLRGERGADVRRPDA